MTINASAKRPVLGVSTLVRRSGAVLLVKRKRAPLEGYWALPGGHVEAGERVAEAAARELLEETGVIVDGLRQIAINEIVTRDGNGGVASHYVLVVFRGDYRAGEAVAGDDAAEACWVPEVDIAGLKMTDDARRIIADNA
jgi:ADP-ribose pyrophosphatase YjhB (NUDIX family)